MAAKINAATKRLALKLKLIGQPGTRIGAATKRLLALKLKEVGKPGKGRIAGGFLSIFKYEIMRQPFFQEMARKQKLASKKKRRKSPLT